MNTGDANESSSSHDLTGLPGSLAGFLEIAFDAVVAFDSQERIIYWNPAAEQMYGWTAQETVGKTPAELFYPLSTPQEQADRKERLSSLERGEILRGEQNASRKDGPSICVQYAARAIFNAAGKVVGYLAIYRDISIQEITEHRQNEESLRARTEEIETLLNVSPVAIFVAHDPECVRISGNPAGYHLVELPEDANISKSAPDPERPTYRVFRNGVEVPAEDLPMQKAARLGVEVSEDELELRFEDGSQKFIYAFAKPLFDAQGQSRGAVAAMLDITERRRTEEQLERSNQKLNEILTSIQDDFYVLDRDWIFVYASRSFTSKIGKEPRDFVGNNIWEMFPKHVGTVFEENFRAAMEKREIQRFEIPGKYTNAWYSMTAFPSPEGITVLGTDITERKRLEAETKSMAKFPQENPNPVLRVSQEGVVLFGNRASQKLLDDWNCSIGTPLPDMWCAEVTERFRLGVPGEALLECNGRIFSLHLVPIVESHYLNIYGRDITEHKWAEQALRESEERLRRMIETSLVAIGFGDSTGKIFDANESFYRLTGYSREEIQASRLGWDKLTAPEYAELDRQMMATLAATGSAGPYEKEYIRKDGSRIPLLLTVSKLPGHDEHIAFIMDISGRKLAEEALQENQKQLQMLNETLEQKVQEKTAEVHRLASDLVKAVQHERHRISHILHDDLQQRIYAIQMQLTLLYDELQMKSEAAQKEVSDIEKQLADVLQVTRHLSIDLSPPILRDEGLAHAINWLAAQMRQRYGLSIELQTEEPFAIADEALHVLLFNCVRELLFNIVKHAQASRAVVTLQWSDADLQIEVRDDGKGFPVNIPEQQASEELREDEGSRPSFGLSTIRHQLSLFGGRMEIQSEPGAGTRVILIVPIVESD